MIAPEIRRRKEATPTAIQQNDYEDAISRQIYDDDDDEKAHTSHFYTIFNLNRICQLCVYIAVVIFAVAWAQVNMLPKQLSGGGIKNLSVVEGNKNGEIIMRYERTAPVYKDFPLHINYLQDEKFSVWFHNPQPIQEHNESGVNIEDYFVGPMMDLPNSFNRLYREIPDLNTDWDIVMVHEELDMGGHVYAHEDFQDDFVELQPDYFKEWYAIDDDVNRSPEINEDGSLTSRCHQSSWYKLHHPTCNKLHEVPILNNDEYRGYYFSSGEYRNVFAVLNEEAILKVGLYDREYNTELFEMIRIDSMTMDILTASERIVNVYSHCGVSVHVEPMNGPDIYELVMPSEREGKADFLPPMLSPTKKLATALMMAEALADLHGYAGGAIGHFDIQMGQYLLDEDHRIKLSDFNRAEPLDWAEAEQEYCKVWMGGGSGNVRSPEEYHERVPIDYNVDVYSYGNILFTLLTGKEPYGDDIGNAKGLCGKGITPPVDLAIRGQSFAEASLATIMDKCFEFYPDKRIDIFTVISLLRDAVHLNNKLESIEVTHFEVEEEGEEEGEEELLHYYYENENDDVDEDEDDNEGIKSDYGPKENYDTHDPDANNEDREEKMR